MDGSFLSNQDIVRASRSFVCIRLATYENAAEAEVLKSYFSGPRGVLENSIYAMLSPDGEERLTRTGRSPGFAFGYGDEAPAEMARTMARLGKRYSRKRRGSRAQSKLRLPILANLRLAINVASCDNRPLVLAFHTDRVKLRAIEKQLAALAWQQPLVGRCEYVLVHDRDELLPIRKLRKDAKAGIYVIRPDDFGEHGRVLGFTATGNGNGNGVLEKGILAGLARYRPHDKDPDEHNRLGRELDVNWKTAIPVTDTTATRRRGGRGKRRRDN